MDSEDLSNAQDGHPTRCGGEAAREVISMMTSEHAALTVCNALDLMGLATEPLSRLGFVFNNITGIGKVLCAYHIRVQLIRCFSVDYKMILSDKWDTSSVRILKD